MPPTSSQQRGRAQSPHGAGLSTVQIFTEPLCAISGGSRLSTAANHTVVPTTSLLLTGRAAVAAKTASAARRPDLSAPSRVAVSR